jgi:hypothetical protein
MNPRGSPFPDLAVRLPASAPRDVRSQPGSGLRAGRRAAAPDGAAARSQFFPGVRACGSRVPERTGRSPPKLSFCARPAAGEAPPE